MAEQAPASTGLKIEVGEALVGLYAADEAVHLCLRDARSKTRETSVEFSPFLWANQLPERLMELGPEVEELKVPEGADSGADAPFRYRLRFKTVKTFREALRLKEPGLLIDALRSVESQFLMVHRLRLFEGLKFSELRRCQIDIETACSREGGFSLATEPRDRVLAIGLRCGGQEHLLTLEEDSDQAERQLLKGFGSKLRELDPDVLEGHNLFKFDLDYLKTRSRRYRVKLDWGRFGAAASFRPSRLRVAERWIDFPRCEIPGRAVFDTFLAIQLWDVSVRDLPSYGLKEVARHLGVTPADGGARIYIEGSDLQAAFWQQRETFLGYLKDDLRETAGLAETLLPTYVAQLLSFPMTLQEAALRGTGSKVDLLFLDRYYHAAAPLPSPPESRSFEGAFSKSFERGVFRQVLHFDVASLYPSLLMAIGRNPRGDTLGVFGPILKELREYRLTYKQRAKEAEKPELQREYEARQQSFKILINSFYGYLGFPGARFGDSALAAEVTQRGRDLLKALIERFGKSGVRVLEADTDGIYLSAPEHWTQPEALLEEVADLLPDGIALEYDGRFEAMFCYKAKNYALYDGERVNIRGSALRSRGTEPFLKELSDNLIHYLLGASSESPDQKILELHEQIERGEIAVERLAKAEYLSQNPESYRKLVEQGGKSRRAALEVALKAEPPMRMGDQVRFFIGPKQEKGQTSDWQRAWPLAAYDRGTCPYDPRYYQKKLMDWRKRYADFLQLKPGESPSTEE